MILFRMDFEVYIEEILRKINEADVSELTKEIALVIVEVKLMQAGKIPQSDWYQVKQVEKQKPVMRLLSPQFGARIHNSCREAHRRVAWGLLDQLQSWQA